MLEPAGLPQVYFPERAATADDAAGRRMVFLYVPHLEVEIKRVLGLRPGQFTYRWAYHPRHRLHVLFVYWPVQEGPLTQVGVGIPEGPGDALLEYMAGGADLYLTLMPVEPREGQELSKAEIQDIQAGLTVHLPGVRLARPGGRP